MTASEQANLGDFGPDLSDLSEAEREVYRRVDLGGEDPERVAGDTDRAETTVSTLLHRARRKRGESPQI